VDDSDFESLLHLIPTDYRDGWKFSVTL